MGEFLGVFGDEENTEKTANSKNQGTEGGESQGSQGVNSLSSGQSDQISQSQQSQGSQKNESGALQLHEEVLDITTSNVNAGEVILSKEVIEEQKTVSVPVSHEEVVIKRTSMNNEQSNASISADEIIHIPVSQEQVQVNKNVVTTEEVSAHKREVEETQQVQESLRREEAHINTTGSVDIITDGVGFNNESDSPRTS